MILDAEAGIRARALVLVELPAPGLVAPPYLDAGAMLRDEHVFLETRDVPVVRGLLAAIVCLGGIM